MVLAIDHRSQFEDPANFGGADQERIAAFKTLGLRALHAVARQERRFGVLLDGRYGFEALSEAADLPYWIGRPIEIPQSRPLEFEGSADVAVELSSWPLNQVVKCLVTYHPDDPADLKERQDRQLQRLFDACRKTRHELLLEVILPPGMPADSRTMSRALSGIYALDVRPDWWKLAAERQRRPLGSHSRYDRTRGSIVSRRPASGTVAARGRTHRDASPPRRRSQSSRVSPSVGPSSRMWRAPGSPAR